MAWFTLPIQEGNLKIVGSVSILKMVGWTLVRAVKNDADPCTLGRPR